MSIQNMQLSEFGNSWLSEKQKICKAATNVKYRSIVYKHILPKLGNYYVDDLTIEIIDNFTDYLVQTCNLSPKTVKDILVILQSIIAYKKPNNPLNFHYPKDIRPKMRVLSINEQKKLMDYLSNDINPCKFGIILSLLSGLRIGEVCALRWEHINMEDGYLYIEKTMQRLQNCDSNSPKRTKIIIDTPKTEHSIRSIPLTSYAISLCKIMNPQKPSAYILTGTDKYMEPRTLQYRFKKYVALCGLEKVHFHTLRHTFATRCIEVGFEIKSLSEILGHANTNITLNRYIHSSLEFKRKNMNKLSSLGM